MAVPPDLLAALQQGGAPEMGPGLGGPVPGGDGGGYAADASPLEVLQECIQSLPAVIAALPDPQDSQDATRAMLMLQGIQTRMMQRGQSPGR